MKKIFLMMLATLVMTSCTDVVDDYFERVDPLVEDPGVPEPEPDFLLPDPIPTGDPDSYWYQAADSATMLSLINRCWPPLLTRALPTADNLDFWAFTERADARTLVNNNYWQQAHAMDAVIDAYNRTPNTEEFYTQKQLLYSIYDKWFYGCPKMQWMGSEPWGASKYTTPFPHAKTGSANGWRNHFIDDMAWMVLTHIRMYESFALDYPDQALKYLNQGKELYDDYIWEWAWDTGWGSYSSTSVTYNYSNIGGLFWLLEVNDDGQRTFSKNSCINGPAMVITGKLAHYAANEEERAKYLDQAEKLYQFMTTAPRSGQNPLAMTSGLVYDNINASGNTSGSALSYNQGTFMGGCHWLYKLTGDENYLARAVATVNYTMNSLQTGSGTSRVLNSHDSGDGSNNSVFSAIFLRYLIPLINEPDIPAATRQGWYDNLARWADLAWTQARGIDKGSSTTPGYMLFGSNWTSRPTSQNLHLGFQVSGAVLIESMNLVNLPIE